MNQNQKLRPKNIKVEELDIPDFDFDFPQIKFQPIYKKKKEIIVYDSTKKKGLF